MFNAARIFFFFLTIIFLKCLQCKSGSQPAKTSYLDPYSGMHLSLSRTYTVTVTDSVALTAGPWMPHVEHRPLLESLQGLR